MSLLSHYGLLRNTSNTYTRVNSRTQWVTLFCFLLAAAYYYSYWHYYTHSSRNNFSFHISSLPQPPIGDVSFQLYSPTYNCKQIFSSSLYVGYNSVILFSISWIFIKVQPVYYTPVIFSIFPLLNIIVCQHPYCTKIWGTFVSHVASYTKVAVISKSLLSTTQFPLTVQPSRQLSLPYIRFTSQ